MDPQNNQSQPQGNPAPAAPVMDTKDRNTVMAVFSYLGPLVIISFLTSKNDPFVKFHIKQGLAVFALEIIVWLLVSMVYSLWLVANVLNLATLVLSIIGIINVIQNQQKELPLIGSFANGFSI